MSRLQELPIVHHTVFIPLFFCIVLCRVFLERIVGFGAKAVDAWRVRCECVFSIPLSAASISQSVGAVHRICNATVQARNGVDCDLGDSYAELIHKRSLCVAHQFMHGMAPCC